MLDDARKRVVWLLSRNRHLVEALRDALLDRHELVGDEITGVLLAATGDDRRVDGLPDDLRAARTA